MNKKYILPLITAILLITSFYSCDEKINTDLVRRSNNDSYFDSFKDSVGYSKATAPAIYGDGYVYMKYLEKGSEDALSPIYTSSVEFRYRTYITEFWLKDSSTAKPIDSNYDKQKLDPTYVNNNIKGVAIALQNMKVGDHVRVAIPWYLAYGEDPTRGLPSYTSLFMDIKLVSVK